MNDLNENSQEGFDFDDKQEVSVTQFKCPSCGNNLEFSPNKQKLVCPYCGTEEDIENVTKVSENVFDEDTFITENSNEDIEIFRCENCGSVSEKQKDGIAFTCPYCHKTNVILEKDIKGIKPTGVVPFRLSLKEGAQKAKEWVKGRFYAPRKFKHADFDTMLSGIYSPCWTFDSKTYSVYQGRVGKRVTRTVGTGKNKHTVTEIRWRNISGEYSMGFDDIKIQAGNSISANQFGKVANFDTNNAVKYDKSFLAGFTAMHYKKGIKNAWSEAKDLMREDIKSAIVGQYNCDVVDYLNVNTSYAGTTYKYLLLPIYLGTYSFHGKTYSTVINGYSGVVWGQYPKSPIKIALTVLLGLGILAAIFYFLAKGNINFDFSRFLN